MGHLLLIASLLAPLWLGAQPIHGQVVDAMHLEPLANANVAARPSDRWAITDGEGRFRIDPPRQHSLSLVVSLVGYLTASVELEDWNGPVEIRLIPNPIALEEVRISAMISSRLAAWDVETVDREEMETTRPISLGEVVGSLAGVDVNSAHDLDRNATVSIRGSSDYKPGGFNNRVLLLLDGFPVQIPNSGAADWNALPLSNLSRMEVTRGPASALYGHNSMGGVINLVTSDISSRPAWSVGGASGSFGARAGMVSANWPGTLSLGIDASATSVQGHRFNSGARISSLEMKSSWTSGPWTVRFSAMTARSRNEHPGFVSEARPDLVSYRVSMRDARYLQLRADRPMGRASWLRSALAVNSFDTRYDDRPGTPTSERETSTRYKDHSFQFRSEVLTTHWPGWTILAGGEGQIDKSRVSVLNPMYGDPVQFTGAAFVQGRRALGRGWEVEGGLRYDVRDVNPGKHFAWRRFHGVSPKWSLVYSAGTTSLHASVNRGFRAPSISELYLLHETSYGLFLQGTPMLRPESLWGLEMGWKRAASTALSLSGALFANRYRDMIDFVYGVPVRAENRPAVDSFGGELQCVAQPSPATKLSVDYSRLEMRNRESLAPVLYRPTHKLRLSAEYRAGSFSTHLSAAYTSRQRYEDFLSDDYRFEGNEIRFPLRWLPARTLVDGVVSWANGPLRISLKGKNLLNLDYELIQDYPMPGRSWTADFTYHRPQKGQDT